MDCHHAAGRRRHRSRSLCMHVLCSARCCGCTMQAALWSGQPRSRLQGGTAARISPWSPIGRGRSQVWRHCGFACAWPGSLSLHGRTCPLNWLSGVGGQRARSLGAHCRATLIPLMCSDPRSLECADAGGTNRQPGAPAGGGGWRVLLVDSEKHDEPKIVKAITRVVPNCDENHAKVRRYRKGGLDSSN